MTTFFDRLIFTVGRVASLAIVWTVPPVIVWLVRRYWLYVIPLFVLSLSFMWGLWRLPTVCCGMYGNSDGMWAAWNVHGILEWGWPLHLSPFNPLAGMGSTFAPYLPWLNPAALSLALPFPRDVAHLVSYVIYFAEVSAANLVLFRALGVSHLRASIAAQVYAVVLFPPWSGAFVSLPWLTLAPMYAHVTAIANLVLALFMRVGRSRWRRELLRGATIVALVVSGLVSAAPLLVAYVPAYASVAIALLLAERPARREFAWKLGGIAAVVLILWALGFPSHLRAMGQISARSVGYPPLLGAGTLILSSEFWLPLWREFDVCGRPYELLCAKLPVFWFHVIAIVGAVIAVATERGVMRAVAAWFLAYYAFVHFYEFTASAYLFGPLNVMSTSYFVWSSYPFLALLSVVPVLTPVDLVSRLLRRWRKEPGGATVGAPIVSNGMARSVSRGLAFATWVLVLLAIPGVASWIATTQVAQFSEPAATERKMLLLGRSRAREPVIGTVTRYLIEHASVRPGDRFRGYTATYFGDRSGHLRNALGYGGNQWGAGLYVDARHYLDLHHGNRFQEIDLWALDIPTFEEYGQWVTRQAAVFAADLFSTPDNHLHPVFLRIYTLDVDLLRVVGVRFIITDARLDDPRVTLRALQTSPTAGPIHLYEIAGANLGIWSPTRPVRADSFSQGIAILRDRKALLADEVVVFGELQGPFVPAKKAELRFVRGGVNVTAESEGRSLLLLPVQYSRCFEFHPAVAKGAEQVRLLRANGIQTLLEFQGRIDGTAAFESGVLGVGRCRRKDVRDLARLGLQAPRRLGPTEHRRKAR